MLFVPFLMIISYNVLPEQNSAILKKSIFSSINLNDVKDERSEESMERNFPSFDSLSLFDKLKLTIPLLKYMIPLFLIFYSEYVINQGLYELMYFKDSTLIKDHSSQYR